MARPPHEHPTPSELEILKIVWQRGPCTGREVMEALNTDGRERAYTSVTSLLNVMAEKGLLRRKPRGRGFIYAARAKKEKTLREMARDLVGRAFDGSASALVAALLNDAKVSAEELDEIRKAISEHKATQPPSK